MSDRSIRFLTLGTIALLAIYSLARLELTNSITHFMPSENDAELVELSLQLVDSPLSHRMVLSIGGSPDRARVAADLADYLRAHPEVDWVESGFDQDSMRGIFDLYFEPRVYLASDSPTEDFPRLLEDESLRASAAQLRARLARPDSMLGARTAPLDPLGLFDRVVDRVRSTQPPSTSADGGFASRDGNYAIVLLGLASSPFDFATQSELLDDIDREFERLTLDHDPPLLLETSGINQVAVASEKSVKREVNYISFASISIVLALFLLVFRSFRHLFIAILTPVAGFVVALAVAVSTSTQMHGITLAFGFVLLGVAIDYPIHLMNHHALSPIGTTPRASLSRIRTSLLSSGITTTFAFLALAMSDFPGLREMGLFAAIGVPISMSLTILCLPAFFGESRAPSRIQEQMSAGFEHLVDRLDRRLAIPFVLFAAFALVAALGIPSTRWEDDPGELMAANPEMLEESNRVRERVADFDAGRFVVGLAPDRESALALNDEIHGRLRRGIDEGAIDGMMSMHSFIWSQRLQRANLEALRADPTLPERLDAIYSEAGFRAGSFDRFAATIAEPGVDPLTPEDFETSPLARVIDSLVHLEGRWAVVTYLRGVHSGVAVRELIRDLDNAHYIDQGEIVAEVYQGFRESTVRMLVVGSGVVFVVLMLRYRDFKRGLLAFLPPALAALTTFGLFGLLGQPVNVVSAVSLLVVLGMGVDYGIFTVDSARQSGRLGATLSSLLISCLTSIFVFGVLAFSGQTALQALGLTVGVGTTLALILSPAVHVLARRIELRRKSGR
jgi:predicted exporter